MELLIWLVVLGGGLGFYFWKYPEAMKQFFGIKDKPVEPEAPSISTEVARIHDQRREGTYESVGDINEPVVPPRHEIVKHDYYRAYNNELWPRWTCRCGASEYVITTAYDPLHVYESQARRHGQAHVIQATQADENLRKSNGNFAF